LVLPGVGFLVDDKNIPAKTPLVTLHWKKNERGWQTRRQTKGKNLQETKFHFTVGSRRKSRKI